MDINDMLEKWVPHLAMNRIDTSTLATKDKFKEIVANIILLAGSKSSLSFTLEDFTLEDFTLEDLAVLSYYRDSLPYYSINILPNFHDFTLTEDNNSCQCRGYSLIDGNKYISVLFYIVYKGKGAFQSVERQVYE